jgi:vacuolar-type H+-ATPase subunit H
VFFLHGVKGFYRAGEQEKSMPEQTPQSGLSPLDQIRQAEAEMNRAIAVARQLASRSSPKPSNEPDLKRQARERRARRQGSLQSDDIGGRAEACAITSEACSRAQEMRSKGQYLLEQGVRYAIGIVISPPEDTLQE